MRLQNQTPLKLDKPVINNLFNIDGAQDLQAYMAAHQINVEDLRVYSKPLVFQSAMEGKLEILKMALSLGAPVDGIHQKMTALTKVCTLTNVFLSSAEVIEVLLDAGANKDFEGDDGLTPLCAACSSGNVKAVEILLKAGANPTHHPIDGCGWTALAYAVETRRLACIAQLIEHGVDPLLACDGEGRNAIEYARHLEGLNAVPVSWKETIDFLTASVARQHALDALNAIAFAP